MPKRIIMRLSSNAKPHIYIHEIKALMEGDTYLHPQMKAMLLMMKKSRAPFLRLATIKEIILYPEKSMHFERVIQPELTGYFRIEWSPEEIIKYKADPKAYTENVLVNYKKMGYDFDTPADMPLAEVQKIENITEPKKK